MKRILITSACLYNGGVHAEAGEIVEVTDSEAAFLLDAGRGYPAPAAEPEKSHEKPKGKK